MLFLARPRLVFGVVLSAVLVTSALLLALATLGGDPSSPLVSAMKGFAGWVGPQTAVNKYWLTGDYGGTTAVTTCPTEVPFQQWQACYYTHNGVTYFDDVRFKLARKDASINFNWQAGSPAAEVPVDNFSARWNGVFAFQPGEYTFSLIKDDGMRVFLDGVSVFDRFYSETKKDFTFKTNITEGNHRLRVEYFESTGDATAKLSWSLTGPSAGGGGGTTTPVTPAATWVGETYKVVSLCNDTDPGKSAVLSAKANVPFGIKMTEGNYSQLISGGSYVALFELPKSDGSYGGDFTALAKNIPNDGGATFRLFQLSTATEIGNQYARVNRHNDCATYTLNAGAPRCNLNPNSVYQVVDLYALADKAETGKQGYINVSGVGTPVKFYLVDKGAGRYEVNALFNASATGNYKAEYYFNDYLRSTKTFTVGKCGPTGTITISDMQPTICQGSTRDISVRAIGNRIGVLWDEKHNAVLTITDPDGDGIFKGEGVVTSGVVGKTLILILSDGAALIPVSVDQQSITPNQNGCAASATLNVTSSVGMCPDDGTTITASATGTVPIRIFIRGINYSNARISGTPGLSVSGTFTPSLGAGGASTTYVAFVVDNSGTELASQQIEILKKSKCDGPLSLSAAQGYSEVCQYNNYQATSGKYLVLWGNFPQTGNNVFVGGTQIGTNLVSFNGNQINALLPSSVATGYVNIVVSNGEQKSNSINFQISPTLPWITSVQGYDQSTGSYEDNQARIGKYLVLWGNFCTGGNNVFVNGSQIGSGLEGYNGNQINVLVPYYVNNGFANVKVTNPAGSSNDFQVEIK